MVFVCIFSGLTMHSNFKLGLYQESPKIAHKFQQKTAL